MPQQPGFYEDFFNGLGYALADIRYSLGQFWKRHQKVVFWWWSVGLLVCIAVLVPVAHVHLAKPIQPLYRAVVFAAEKYCLVSILSGLFLYLVAGLMGFFRTVFWLYQNTPRFFHVARAAKAAWLEAGY